MKPRTYGPFAYTPIGERPPLVWPGGARVAVLVIPNVEFFALDDRIAGAGTPPDVPEWSIRDYGNRIGIFRLMDVLDRYGIRGTVALNADVCTHHPAIIDAGMRRGWEWMGHNLTNTVRLNALPPEGEREHIRATLDVIAAATGTRPVGWLGAGLQETWNTLDHLAAEGVTYVADWTNDDQPYVMELEGGRRLVAVAYSQATDDKVIYDRLRHSPAEFRDIVIGHFDRLYREGTAVARCMAIAVHPYLSGQPFRIDALDEALAHICSREGVWLTTGGELACYLCERTFA